MGEVLLGGGRRMGRWGMAWGAAIGSLPDLDVVMLPFLGQVERIGWHRGITHSVIVAAAVAPLLGWVLRRFSGGRVGFLWGSVAAFVLLAGHIFLDVITIYGTQVLAPLSDWRAGTGLLFIIDPVFTAALLVGVVAAVFLRDEALRRKWAAGGMAVAGLYLCWCVGAKTLAEARFAGALEANGIEPLRMMTAPAPFQSVVWRGLAETEDAFYAGYVRAVGEPGAPALVRLPKNRELLEGREDEPAVAALLWFSNGYLGAETLPGGGLRLSDWRFGEVMEPDGDAMGQVAVRAVFAWELAPEAGEGGLQRVRVSRAGALHRAAAVLRGGAGGSGVRFGQ